MESYGVRCRLLLERTYVSQCISLQIHIVRRVSCGKLCAQHWNKMRAADSASSARNYYTREGVLQHYVHSLVGKYLSERAY